MASLPPSPPPPREQQAARGGRWAREGADPAGGPHHPGRQQELRRPEDSHLSLDTEQVSRHTRTHTVTAHIHAHMICLCLLACRLSFCHPYARQHMQTGSLSHHPVKLIQSVSPLQSLAFPSERSIISPCHHSCSEARITAGFSQCSTVPLA